MLLLSKHWCLDIYAFTTCTGKNQTDVKLKAFVSKDTCTSVELCNKTLVDVLNRNRNEKYPYYFKESIIRVNTLEWMD